MNDYADVRRYRRCCKHGVCAAPLPPRPIPGGIAGPGLVSAVLVGKFSDHLPLYRLEDMWIRQLYDIEDRARSGSADRRLQLRRAEAVPLLDQIETYTTELARKALPKSSLAKAVQYARNQWAALRRYTEDGRLTIDNNVSERTLRHQAIGRKNWLFLGSEGAGPRAAVLATILAGAKRHRIEPWSYVRDLLLRLHADDPRLEEMLPDRWAAAHPEAILSHRLDESRARAARTQARRAHRRARCT